MFGLRRLYRYKKLDQSKLDLQRESPTFLVLVFAERQNCVATEKHAVKGVQYVHILIGDRSSDSGFIIGDKLRERQIGLVFCNHIHSIFWCVVRQKPPPPHAAHICMTLV